MDSAAGGMAAIGAVGMLFMLLLAILWILVPFAIFGIKPLLRDLIAEQRKTYAALATMSQQIHTASLLLPAAATSEPARTPQPADRGRVEPTLGQLMQDSAAKP